MNRNRVRRHPRKTAGTPVQDAATNIGERHRKVLMIGVNENGFRVFPKEPPPDEFVELVHAHSDRLRALLDNPVVLCVHWGGGR
jgi:hypothetical protein